MNIQQFKSNHVFYEGYEGEPEVTLTFQDNNEICLHIWVGYLDDILSSPLLNGTGWSGFTRDYHQLEGAFGLSEAPVEINPSEYLNDLLTYQGKTFQFPETQWAFSLLVQFLQYAADYHKSILVSCN